MSSRILLVTGSTRTGSTNTAALRTVRATAPAQVTAVLYERLADLPAFNPDADRDPLPPVVAELRAEIAAADAVLFCAPEYAGALPGSFKNLLDWTVGGGEIYGKPVAWINVAPEGRGDGARAELATVLGYVGALVVDSACRRVYVPRDGIAADGTVTAAEPRQRIAALLADLIAHTGPSTGP